MPPEQIAPQEPYKFNLWETDPKKNFAPWFLMFCVALIIIGLGVAGYFKYKAYQSYKADLAVVEQSKTEPRDPPLADFTGWQTYRNEEYGFEFSYSQSWVLKDLMPQTNSNPVIDSYNISIGYTSPEQNALRGITYCEAYSSQSPRCEVYKGFIIDWEYVSAMINDTVGGTVEISLKKTDAGSKETFRQILSTFKFIESAKVSEPIFCTQDAKMCPNGSYVGRTGPNCEFVCP